jgi:hypothetical protein
MDTESLIDTGRTVAGAFDFELLQMLFGLSGKRTHRVLFAIHDHRIVVYAARHLAQRGIDRTDIE